MMRSLRHWPVLVTLIALFPAAPAHGDDAWALGRSAFAVGDYALALNHFQRARDAGQRGPAVHYNIAVCEFKLGDFAAAGDSFARLDEQFPAMRPLAQYNLGLVALRLDDPLRAERHFRNSYRLGNAEPKLRALAVAQLERLADETVPASRWLRTLSARAGYDDNVVLQDETGIAANLEAGSSFIEAYGTLRGPYPGWHGLRLDGGFFVLRYPDVHDFDQAAANVGVLHEWRLDDWTVDSGVHVATTTLGGDGFDRSVRVSLRVTRRLNAGSSIAARYRYDDVSAIDSIFDGIEGSRARYDVSYRWYDSDRHLRVGVTRETNDRADPGVSPDKTALQAHFRHEPELGWGYGIGAQIRSSDFGEIVPARDEDLLEINLRVTRHTQSGWQLFAELLRADNDSSDPAFSYDRNQLSVGVYRMF